MISVNANAPKTHTMQELYAEAIRQMKEEVRSLKKAPLTPEEDAKLELIAKSVSNEVVRRMKV
jgi:hypothetical protein